MGRLEELLDRLRQEADGAYTWSNGPGDRYAAHSHPYEKVLYCVEGSITFLLEADGRSVDLQPGDRLLLPPNTSHAAVVGPAGCVCVEGHREGRGQGRG